MTTEEMKEASKISYVDWIDPDKISIDNMWKVYAVTCLTGKTFSAEQYQEIQTSFCIGFIEAFKLLTDVASDLPEEKACTMFSNIAAEANHIAEIKLKIIGNNR